MTSTFSLFADLKSRIDNRQAAVATVGLGYVGLPLALTAHDAGFMTTGFDVNVDRVRAINRGERIISYFANDRVSTAVRDGRFTATKDFARLADMDVILICVPTPLSGDDKPDLTYVRQAAGELAQHLRPGQLVVLESTVWPGATRDVVRPLLETSGLEAGSHFFLAYSPEREDPGNEQYSTRTIPKIVGADDAHSRDLVAAFYGLIVDRAVPVSSTMAAETVKLAENSFRTVNIALVNEMKFAFQKMGVDVWEVIEAAATKPFGFMPFWPGPGIGGDCIPVSPVYLSWRAREVGGELPMIELATRSSREIAGRVTTRVAEAAGGELTGKSILLLGIAYKRDVEDSRRSPALAILREIEAAGAKCDFHDPFFPVLPETRDDPDLAGRRSAALTAEAVASYDAVLVATDHTDVDYRLISENAKSIVDTRNVFAKLGLGIRSGRLFKA